MASAGTVATINDTAPTSDRWNLATVEILAGTAAPETTAVPDVVGLTQAAAASTITDAGLTVGAVTTASSTTIAAGTVISQNPSEGTEVVLRTAVALLVSSGPPTVATPNVIGLPQAVATSAITGAGLTVGAVTTAVEHDGAGGLGDQSEPGQRHAGRRSRCAVAFVVSSGPPQVERLNVVGLTQAAATSAITGVSLTARHCDHGVEH